MGDYNNTWNNNPNCAKTENTNINNNVKYTMAVTSIILVLLQIATIAWIMIFVVHITCMHLIAATIIWKPMKILILIIKKYNSNFTTVN